MSSKNETTQRARIRAKMVTVMLLKLFSPMVAVAKGISESQKRLSIFNQIAAVFIFLIL